MPTEKFKKLQHRLCFHRGGAVSFQSYVSSSTVYAESVVSVLLANPQWLTADWAVY